MRLLLSVILATALLGSTEFDDKIQTARTQIENKEFDLASTTIIGLRNGIQDRRSRPTNVKGLEQKVASASVPGLLQLLDQAQARHSMSDTGGTVEALDLAGLYATALHTHQPPAERLTLVEARVSEESSQSDSGEASLLTLVRASREAYQAGDYSATQNYANRALKVLANNPREDGQLVNWEHTLLGLSYLAQGDEATAVHELNASINTPGKIRLPSMALANALVQQQAQAVISFLDAVSQRPESTVKDSAQRWKTDLENGVKPSFGGMAMVGTGASPSRKRPELNK